MHFCKSTLMSCVAIFSSSMGIFAAQNASAKDCPVGQAIFVDTMYGMGAGTLVGSLWMLANIKETKGDDIVPNLSTAALIGGGLGAIIGVVEVGICVKNQSAPAQAGMQPLKAVFLASNKNQDTGLGFKFEYILK